MKLTFLGGAGTVTGSKYLLEDDNKKILIDCGMFQGQKELRLRNWAALPIPATEIDAVILTHAHIDHSGYIPRLMKAGFNGPVYCSEATRDLCAIMLPDSGHIHEEDAARANRYGYTKHKPALPLYTEEEAHQSLELFKPVGFAKPVQITDELSFTLHRAGHILGASSVRITDTGGTSVVFSGDLGRYNDPIMNPPVEIQDVDYLVVESTYGDELHGREDPGAQIGEIVNRTVERGGTIIIPAFAVGRAQLVMYYIWKLKQERKIPSYLPVYLDSPMAINASDLMCKHHGEHRLSEQMSVDMCDVAEYVHTSEESKSLDQNGTDMPKVIISASGMATGGRVLHHLKYYLGDLKNTILMTGFQASMTRGDRLVRGEKEIKIHGDMWPVRAEVIQLHSMSAHADYEEILRWMEGFTRFPRKVFVTHGEPEASMSLRDKIKKKFDCDVVVPEYLQTESI